MTAPMNPGSVPAPGQSPADRPVSPLDPRSPTASANTAVHPAVTGPVSGGALPELSLVSELKTAAFWLALAAYVPTIWTLFNLPTGGEATVIQVLKVIALVIGPIVSAVNLVVHAVKVKANQSRLAAIETASIAAWTELSKAGVPADIKVFLQGLHGV